MSSRRLPRLTVALAAVLALALVACSDDEDGGGGDTTSTPSFTLPPRTDGPGRPTGEAALRDALLTKDEVNADVDPDDSAARNDLFTYGVGTPADEFGFCGDASTLQTSEPVAHVHVSYQDFLGGEIDERVLRYGSPERAAEVLAAVRAQFAGCNNWLFTDSFDREVRADSQDVDIPIGTEVDEEFSVNVFLRLSGVTAVNNYLIVRDGDTLLRLRTSYGQGTQRLAGDWIDLALEKLRALPE